MKLFKSLVIGSLVAASTQAMGAQTTCIHGTNAVFESPDRVTESYKGWGADFKHTGQNNWIHFQVPTESDNKYVQAVRVKFFNESVDVSLDAVHIYNAQQKVKSFNNLRWNTQGWNTKSVAMNNTSVQNGIGISILARSGVESLGHRQIISSVCVDYSNRGGVILPTQPIVIGQ